jgi:hypothetical protein
MVMRMIRSPAARPTLLVLHRLDLACALFNQVAQAGQLQAFAPYIHAALLYRCTDPLFATEVDALMAQRAFGHMLVHQHLGLNELVAEAARAVRQRVDHRDGNIFGLADVHRHGVTLSRMRSALDSAAQAHAARGFHAHAQVEHCIRQQAEQRGLRWRGGQLVGAAPNKPLLRAFAQIKLGGD